MIERLLWLSVKLGVDRALKDPRFLERHLLRSYGDMGVKPAEVKRMITAFQRAFTDHPTPVIHQFARTNTRWPCWAIVLGDEHEDMSLMGQFAGRMVSNAEAAEGSSAAPHDPDGDAPVMGAFEAHTFHVFSYAEHPDFALLMYYAAKAFVRRAHPQFVAAGIHGLKLSGGDIGGEEEFYPPQVYVRRLTLQCGSQQEVIGDLDEAERRAFSIGGITATIAETEAVLDDDDEGEWDILGTS